MVHSLNSDQVEQRRAFTARKLAQIDIDIAKYSESRHMGEGQLTEHGGGYTFLWKVKAKKRRTHSWCWLCYQDQDRYSDAVVYS